MCTSQHGPNDLNTLLNQGISLPTPLFILLVTLTSRTETLWINACRLVKGYKYLWGVFERPLFLLLRTEQKRKFAYFLLLIILQGQMHRTHQSALTVCTCNASTPNSWFSLYITRHAPHRLCPRTPEWVSELGKHPGILQNSDLH